MTEERPDESRKLGVEFGALNEELESHDYRATKAELVDTYGDRTLGLPDGETTFAAALEPFESDGGFGSAAEVRQAVLTMVGSDAVGRERYSDRGIGNRLDEDDRSI